MHQFIYVCVADVVDMRSHGEGEKASCNDASKTICKHQCTPGVQL